MLGRRQIREKVIENTYAYYQNPIDHTVAEKNLFSSISKIFSLYIYELNFFLGLRHLAEEQIEIHRKKFFKSPSAIHPHEKFIQNKILLRIENNPERISFTEKHKELVWDLHEDILLKTFQKMIAGKRYQDYIKEPHASFFEDQKFIGKIFLRYMAENEDFHSFLEDKELGWSDDFHIANSMIQKTIGFMQEDKDDLTLLKMLKDEQDREFAKNLLKFTLENCKTTEKILEQRLENWGIDRISLLDKIILVTAISELDHFPLTPSKVIINEYIEISKVFSTEKSNIFVNGILDKYTKDKNRN
ncbi:MAG: transcription antitermination factor NusB [Bergeyella sp.]|nr:transcription antitermination factor NusB [Bergeyella sp.]